MKSLFWYWPVVLVSLAACTSGVPYRNGEYAELDCAKIYGDYDATLAQGATPALDAGNACWKQSREKHRDYDALFVEFDDQGWVQGAAGDNSSTKKDHLSDLLSAVENLRKTEQYLSIAVFVHGWQHNAEATDSNVHAFRRMLTQLNAIETAAAGKGPKPRVVGIYVGWRGRSLKIPYLDNVTFWERKNTAEKVAQGEVQELFLWLDWLRDTERGKNDEQYVTVLTIGHSFGGLITFEALNGEFVRNGVRFKRNITKAEDRFMSRVGDMVVIANPAFEGSRYEGLRAVARRFPPLERNQLPVVIVATSDADWATGLAFPIARRVSTLFESTNGEQDTANVKSVGHNSRYITHELSLCNSPGCKDPCKKASALGHPGAFDAEREYEFMGEIARDGFDPGKPKPEEQQLCDGLVLKWTAEAVPDHNPYWVVRTTGDIMRGHNDIFNDNMVSFVRQMFTAFIVARNQSNEKRRSQAKDKQ